MRRASSATIENPPDAALYFRLAVLIGVGLTLLRLLWLAAGRTDLYPDEAQYWLWSLDPDWGYFSKPPLIAWIIAATTRLFGDGAFGVRAAAPVLHFVTSLAVFGAARRLYDPRTACWSAVVFLTLPGVAVSAALISTDAPLLACWATALYAFIRAREDDGWIWWIAVGVAGGLGLLAKYAMAYWLLSAFLYLALFREERRFLGRFLAATLLALLIYSPNLAWNLSHGLVSYRHIEANANLGGSLIHPGHFAEFFGSQFGVFGPILFAALIALVAWRPRDLAEPRARLLATFALPTLAMMLIVSFLSRAHPNWAAPTYVSATIIVVARLLRVDAAPAWAAGFRRRFETALPGWPILLSAALGLHILAGAYIMAAPDLARAAHLRLPSRLDPWSRLRGWSALGHAVSDLQLRYPGHRLLAEDRELMAALVYYVWPHPFDIQEWNPSGRIHDHFALTTNLDQHIGEDFLFVSAAEDIAGAAPSFEAMQLAATITIPRGPDRFRRYSVYDLRGFKGYR